MKKLILFILILSLWEIANAQTKSIYISEKEIGTISCQYTKSINLDKKDTTTFIMLSFQNAEYSSLVDLKYIFFSLAIDSADVFGFVKDLKTALAEMGNKADLLWDRKKYSISLYDFSPVLYLSGSKSERSGYAKLGKKDVEELIAWFEEIGFKK